MKTVSFSPVRSRWCAIGVIGALALTLGAATGAQSSDGAVVVPVEARTPDAAAARTDRADKAAKADKPVVSKRAARAAKDAETQEAAREAEVARLMEAFAAAQRLGDAAAGAQVVTRLRGLLPPDSVALARRAAWVAQMQGERDTARRLLTQVLGKLPDDLNAHMNLALIDAHDGRTADAVLRLRKAKLQHPEAFELDALLAELEGRSVVVQREAPVDGEPDAAEK